MRLENVVAVTGGRLLNTPSISRFETVALLPSKAARGSLFVALDPAGIEEALKNGAYGIITDKQITPTDDEVAWIEVDNLSDTLVKLLRLWLVVNNRKFIYTPQAVMEFMRMIANGHGAVLLPKDPMEASEKILASTAGQTIFCDDKGFLDKIGAAIAPAEPEPVDFTPISGKIFESSFILEGSYHQNAPLACCMGPLFAEAVGLLKAAGAGYTLSHLEHTPSFKPVFVDSGMRAVEWGSSEQVLIFADISLPNSCYEQLNLIKWTRSKLFVPTQIKFECDIKIAMERYDTASELIDRLGPPLRPGFYMIVGVGSDLFFDTNAVTNGNFETKGLF